MQRTAHNVGIAGEAFFPKLVANHRYLRDLAAMGILGTDQSAKQRAGAQNGVTVAGDRSYIRERRGLVNLDSEVLAWGPAAKPLDRKSVV